MQLESPGDRLALPGISIRRKMRGYYNCDLCNPTTQDSLVHAGSPLPISPHLVEHPTLADSARDVAFRV